MKQFICLFYAFLISNFAFSQINISGIVRDKKTGIGIPGVSILIKGTNSGTVTNETGEFLLSVPSDTSKLIFQAVGLKMKEVNIQGSRFLNIQLKEDCIADFFNSRYIGLNLFNGLIHSPYGGLLDLFYHYKNDTAIQLKFGYQSNFKQNSQIVGELGIVELLKNCDYNLDIKLGYNQIDIPKNDFYFQSLRGEARLDFAFKSYGASNILFLGFGKARLNYENVAEKNYGYELGLGKYVWARTFVFMKASTWLRYWQFEGGLETKIKKFTGKIAINSIKHYFEVNMTLGFNIRY